MKMDVAVIMHEVKQIMGSTGSGQDPVVDFSERDREFSGSVKHETF
jgi:hypothetical protein